MLHSETLKMTKFFPNTSKLIQNISFLTSKFQIEQVDSQKTIIICIIQKKSGSVCSFHESKSKVEVRTF